MAPNIAITGKFRSGKDTAGKYLCEYYGYTRFAFGDALKEDFHRRYPEIPCVPKPRVGYQMHGQMMRRLLGEDVWVRKCFDEICSYLSNFGYFAEQPIVITDLRQPNEYSRCRAEGYVIIRINCPDETRLERAKAAGDEFTLEDFTHETESYVDTFVVDYDVNNSGEVSELYTQVDAIMTELGVKKVAQ